MANVAAIRIEHARLAEVEAAERVMQRDLSQAAEIQTGMLPSRAPDIAGVDLAGFNVPCRTVGGDYYDFFPYAGPSVGLALGDVSGKGMAASLMMMASTRASMCWRKPPATWAISWRGSTKPPAPPAPATALSHSSSAFSMPPRAICGLPMQATIRPSCCAPPGRPKCSKAAARCSASFPSPLQRREQQPRFRRLAGAL